ncbi:MAG: sulfite exporter TauE/SafE family protein [Chthoniobacterales bacterium]
MEPSGVWVLALAMFVVALLYSSVGHAGASGYIAVLTLAGLGVEVIRPTALALNILVAAIGFVQWWRAGHFSWALFWPFALLSVPGAFLGGWVEVPADYLQILLGVVLWFSAWRLFCRKEDPPEVARPRRRVALASGAGLGFLSGLTGTGGGIFLTPLMLFCRWARVKEAAAVSSLFILVNSSSGLAGYAKSGRDLPEFAWPLVVVVAIGGFLGSRLGSRHLPARGIAMLLAVVLVIAGAKLVLG